MDGWEIDGFPPYLMINRVINRPHQSTVIKHNKVRLGFKKPSLNNVKSLTIASGQKDLIVYTYMHNLILPLIIAAIGTP